MLAKGITPIERAIAGEPADRRRRYEHRAARDGIKRITVMVREEHAQLFHDLGHLSRQSKPGDSAGWDSIMSEPTAFMAEVRAKLAND